MPHTCEVCGQEHDGQYGSGRFCSQSCGKKHSASFTKLSFKSKSAASQPNSVQHAKEIVVLEPGSCYLRVGFADQSAPHIIPHVVAYQRYRGDQQAGDFLNGDVAASPPAEGGNTADGSSGLVDYEGESPLWSDTIAALENDFFGRGLAKPSKRPRQYIAMAENGSSTLPPGGTPMDRCFTVASAASGAAPSASVSNTTSVGTNAATTAATTAGNAAEGGAPTSGPQGKKKMLVGEEAFTLAPNSGYVLRRPFRFGDFNLEDNRTVTNVRDELAAIWRHALIDVMHVDPKDVSVLLLLPETFERRTVKEMLHTLLRDVGVLEVAVNLSCVCATYGAGLSSACVVDIGASKVSVACVEDGMVLSRTRVRAPYGGDNVTSLLARLLRRVARFSGAKETAELLRVTSQDYDDPVWRAVEGLKLASSSLHVAGKASTLDPTQDIASYAAPLFPLETTTASPATTTANMPPTASLHHTTTPTVATSASPSAPRAGSTATPASSGGSKAAATAAAGGGGADSGGGDGTGGETKERRPRVRPDRVLWAMRPAAAMKIPSRDPDTGSPLIMTITPNTAPVPYQCRTDKLSKAVLCACHVAVSALFMPWIFPEFLARASAAEDRPIPELDFSRIQFSRGGMWADRADLSVQVDDAPDDIFQLETTQASQNAGGAGGKDDAESQGNGAMDDEAATTVSVPVSADHAGTEAYDGEGVPEEVHPVVHALDAAVLASVKKIRRPETKKRMLNSVLLIGGGAHIPGLVPVLEDRIFRGMDDVAVFSDVDRVEVLLNPKRASSSYLSWRGAAISVQACDLQHMWITGKEWEETGAKLLRERAPFVWSA